MVRHPLGKTYRQSRLDSSTKIERIDGESKFSSLDGYSRNEDRTPIYGCLG